MEKGGLVYVGRHKRPGHASLKFHKKDESKKDWNPENSLEHGQLKIPAEHGKG